MGAAVEDVHHRDGQNVGVRAAEVLVEGKAGGFRGGLGDGDRHAEDGVGAEFALVGRAVEGDEVGVDAALVLGVVGFDDLRADFLVDGLDGALNTLAEVAGCVAVTAFDGLEGASRRAGGHAGTGARAILELDLDLDGRVSAGIENFAGVKINNDGHSHSFCLSARRRRPPRLGKHP